MESMFHRHQCPAHSVLGDSSASVPDDLIARGHDLPRQLGYVIHLWCLADVHEESQVGHAFGLDDLDVVPFDHVSPCVSISTACAACISWSFGSPGTAAEFVCVRNMQVPTNQRLIATRQRMQTCITEWTKAQYTTGTMQCPSLVELKTDIYADLECAAKFASERSRL